MAGELGQEDYEGDGAQDAGLGEPKEIDVVDGLVEAGVGTDGAKVRESGGEVVGAKTDGRVGGDHVEGYGV